MSLYQCNAFSIMYNEHRSLYANCQANAAQTPNKNEGERYKAGDLYLI